MSEKPDEKEEVSSERQFYKIVKDFVRDILITFPEFLLINSLYFSLIFFISETGRSCFVIIVFS